MRPVTPLALVLAGFIVAAIAGCGGPVPPATSIGAIPPSGRRAVAGGDTRSGASTFPSATPRSSGASRSADAAASPVSPADLAGTIAFSFDDGVWTSDADGAHRRRLSHDGGFDPTLSPNGKEIVYRLLLEHDDGEIWAMSASGAGAHDLVDDPAFSDWGPAWSPDGRRIAFDSNRRGGLAIWLMDADGSHQQIVTAGHGEYPSWSPDGTKLAYSGGSYYDIRVVGIDGSNDHALTSSPAYDMGPAWSPDGAWIAYHTQADAWPRVEEAGMGPEMEIHLVRPDGSDDHRITDDDVEDSFPAWSPDGRFLMWARHGELVVARPDGSGRIDIGPGNFPTWIP